MNIGERIRKLRKTLDLTQQKFGERLGIKGNTVAQYELGRSNPVDSVFSLICREFNVNEEWLRNGTGEMFNSNTNSELDALIKKYGLSGNARIVIEKFINLKTEQQDVVINYIKETAKALNDSDIASQPSDNEFAEELSMTVEEAEAEYKKSISNFAKNTTSTASSTTINIKKENDNDNKAANQ